MTATKSADIAAVSAVSSANPAPAPVVDTRAAVAVELQQFLRDSQRDVEFHVDEESGAQVVTVRDAVSGDVVRQMPTEDVLKVLRYINAQSGTLFQGKT